MAHGGQDAQRHRQQHRGRHGQGRQQQGGRQLGHEGAEHVPAGHIACAHVAGQQPPQPGEILAQKRPVQSQLRPLGVDDLLGHRPLVAVQLGDGIASGQAHHGEGQKRDAQQHRDQLQQSLCNVFFIVLDLRLTKDWLSGIDSLFLCSFPSKNIASLSGRDGYPIPRIYRHYHKWIPSPCLK